jgi:hypothetical protein
MISSSIKHQFFFDVEESDYDPSMEVDAGSHLLSQLMHAMRFGGRLRVEGAVWEASPESLKLGWWLVGLMRKHEGVQTKPNNHHG